MAPGGRVDPGGTPREAARRELFEETGPTVDQRSPPDTAAPSPEASHRMSGGVRRHSPIRCRGRSRSARRSC
ncbi:NUDIX domain-containing protein [Streptomyces sp. NPDC058371]|uniref:NUDIX domain-containing protein n=1 Tax=Streptomyces sp. NPDC058371 TaxID=3346463 RepID=UPI003664FDFB